MKKIKFSCLNCNAKLRVPTHLAGVSAPCPKCGNTITAPMEIDDAVEEVVVKRKRSTSRSRVHSSTISSGGGATAIAEPPQIAERPRREQMPAAQPAAERVEAQPEPQLPEPEPIVTETFLKPAAEAPLPTPLMPEPPVEEAPAVFPQTFLPLPTEPGSYESAAPRNEEPPTSVPPVSEHFSHDGEPEVVPAEAPFNLPEPSVQEQDSHSEFSDPPPLPETQPIRTVARPDNLPPLHSAPQGEAGELPRLDVGLAGESNGVSIPGRVIEGAGGQGMTKLRLPQPGEETKRFTPADFIAPAESPEVAVSEELTGQPVEDFYSAPVDEPFPAEDLGAVPDSELVDESYQIVDPEESYLEPESQPLESLETTGFEEPPFMVPSEDTVSEEASVMDSADLAASEEPPSMAPADHIASEEPPVEEPIPQPMPWEIVSETVPEVQPEKLPEEEPVKEESVEESLEGGSFEKLFAQQAIDAPTPDSTEQKVARSDDFFASADKATFPISGLEAQPIVRNESRSDNDVLEEMFGSSKSGRFRPKKSTVIIAGVIALLALVAVGVVIFAGSALGFWGSAPTSMDPVTVAPESMRPKEPEPEAAETPGEPAGAPQSEDATAAINPNGAEKVDSSADTAEKFPPRSTLSLPGDTAEPVRIIDSSVPQTVDEPAAVPAPPKPVGNTAPANEPEALSFDERVQNIVNGNGLNPDASAVMNEAVPSENLNTAVGDAIGNFAAGNAPADGPVVVENYNPPEFFAVPGPNDGPLGKTHDVIDAFLRAPDWKTRSKYAYQADSLTPAMEEYYKKWPDNRLDRFSLQLFQMEEDPELGGPYWVYLASTSDTDSGFPLIVRSENGNLKVDWEIHSEFFDEHFVKFQNGGIAAPQTFRLVIERVTDYYGPDRDGFTDLSDYYVYQINPPYGDLNEFSEYAFVKRDSEVAAKLDEVVGLGAEPLAVIVTLDYQSFQHGVKHLTVTDYVTEGWFR